MLLLFGSMVADVLKPNSMVVNIHPIQRQVVAVPAAQQWG
jgi:hypothetical protein